MADFAITSFPCDLGTEVYREHFDLVSFVSIANLMVIAAQKRNDTTIRVYFRRRLQPYTPSLDVSRYTITGPSVLTVTSVLNPNNQFYVDLIVSGGFVAGTYEITVAASTVLSREDEQLNIVGTVDLASTVLPAVAPTLTVLAPIGGSIGTQTPWRAHIDLDELDGAITRIIVTVAYPTGVHETVYIDGAPTSDYSGLSSVVEETPGHFVLSIIRNAGWPGSPRVFVHANTDRGGMTES